MRVIRKGSDKVHRTTCRFCNSDLAYTDADMFYSSEEKRGGIRKTVSHIFGGTEEYVNICRCHYRCVVCPVCHNIIKFIDFSNGGFGETVRWEKA